MCHGRTVPAGINEMNEFMKACQEIADRAKAQAQTRGGTGYGLQYGAVNGKAVKAYAIPARGSFGGDRRASVRLQWSVDGRVVSAANLESAISGGAK